jgi:hypothetical protein
MGGSGCRGTVGGAVNRRLNDPGRPFQHLADGLLRPAFAGCVFGILFTAYRTVEHTLLHASWPRALVFTFGLIVFSWSAMAVTRERKLRRSSTPAE